MKPPLNLGISRLCTSVFLCFFLAICILAIPAMSRIQVHDFMPVIPTSKIPYSYYCNHIVAEAPLQPNSSTSTATFRSLDFSAGYFTGGEDLFNSSAHDFLRSVSLSVFSAHKTISDQTVLRIEARLTLRLRRSFTIPGYWARRKLRVVQYRGPRFPRSFRFGSGLILTGFWSASTGKLCMVGSGLISTATDDSKSVDAVLKLNYSANSSIYGSLVGGVLESADSKAGLRPFEPLWLLGVVGRKSDYTYTLLDLGKTGCGENSGEGLGLEGLKGGLCSVQAQLHQVFRLKYEGECREDGTCKDGYLPEFMYLVPLECNEESKIRFVMSFHNSSGMFSSFEFDPHTSLIAEGAWDAQRNRFCAVACKISKLSASEIGVVGDCSTRVSFKFPAVLSIRARSGMAGKIWREKESGYSSEIKFSSLMEPLWSIPGLRYEYTETDRAICGEQKSSKRKGKDYPSGHSSDMDFSVKLKISRRDKVAGFAHASPLFVGDELYHNRYVLSQGANQPGVAQHMIKDHKEFINISYGFRFPIGFKFEGNGDVSRSTKLSAEGTYDKSTGSLCMVGCQSVEQHGAKNTSLDCHILIHIQFSPLKSRRTNRLTGSIKSTRDKSDPLYFASVELWSQSLSSLQAKESVQRMELEVIMLLISSTLSCVFLGVQLYHVKKTGDAVPLISFVMLCILTLGSMVPLLLRIGALLKPNTETRSMLFGDGGGLEAKEIVARILAMISLLLDLRWLQLCWRARQGSENIKSILDSEKKVVCVLLPLYAAGGLISWLLNRIRNNPSKLLSRQHPRNLLYRPFYLRHRSRHHRPLWTDLKSYGGLILDEFLLPQVVFNAVYDSNQKSLAGAFYMGTTLTRLLPHAYDLYRDYSFPKSLDWSYIYGDHRMDYYSTAWNILIPFSGLLLAFLVFLQQRFGGRVILPHKFLRTLGYQKLPMASNVELQTNITPASVDSS